MRLVHIFTNDRLTLSFQTPDVKRNKKDISVWIAVNFFILTILTDILFSPTVPLSEKITLFPQLLPLNWKKKQTKKQTLLKSGKEVKRFSVIATQLTTDGQ